MSIKKPLVLSDTGALEQLQSGDNLDIYLPAPVITKTDGTAIPTSVVTQINYTFAIKDYDKTKNYIITSSGTIGSINTDGTFSYTPPTVTAQSTDSIFIYFTYGAVISQTNKYDFTVLPLVADGTISNTDFTANESSATDVTVATETLTATADGGTYIENVVEQDATDDDWIKADNTKVIYSLPREIVVDASSTATALNTFTTVAEGDEVVTTDSNNVVTKGALGTVTDGAISESTLDVFGDGSCIALYRFENNANDVSGNYNGTWTGTEAYATGKFGQAAKNASGNNYVEYPSDFPQNNLVTISVWFYLDSSVSINDTHVHICGAPRSTSTSTDSPVVSLYFHSNQLIAERFYTSNVYQSRVTNFGFSYNTWYHLCATVDDNGAIIYINNTKVDVSNDYKDYWGGKEIAFNTRNSIAGLIDQVRIFNRALTEDEVAVLYSEGYSADISSFNLTEAPAKAFFDDKVNVYMDIAADSSSIDLANATALDVLSTTYDGTNFTNTYDKLIKQGRAIQRKLELTKKDIVVKEPFTTDMWKV